MAKTHKATPRKPLLPIRHTQDLFYCDALDAIPKDDMASMEHPIFSLQTRPDTSISRYEHRNTWVEIAPSVRGKATIHDKDIIIYCISQLMAAKNAGEPISQDVYLNARDLMTWTNRETSGDGYQRLREAFDRLSGTRITTNIQADGEAITEGFGLLESWRIVRETGTGRMSEIKVRLSDWVFKMVEGREVLTLSRDYFRLRKPIERRVYEIARKHCGEQDEWKISLELLLKKAGANSHLRAFRADIRKLAQSNHLPDYNAEFDDDTDSMIFRNRKTLRPKEKLIDHKYPILDPEAYHDARMVAPGLDVYVLESEWREWWLDSGAPELGNPTRAFIGFCKKRGERNKAR